MRHSSWKTIVALVVLAACSSDSTGPFGLPTVDSISVSLASPTLVAGQTTQAYATLKDAEGRSITVSGDTVEWASSNPQVASIAKKTGIVTALTAGTATISARAAGRVGSTDVTVTVPISAVRSISVSLGSSTLGIGNTTQATAVAKDAEGKALTGHPMAWNSSDANIASVSSSGMVTGKGPGTAVIQATSDGMVGTASLTVLPSSIVANLTLSLNVSRIEVGSVAQGTVTARDAGGNVVTGLPTTWSSSNEDIARVSPTGAITGLALGTAVISATVDGRTATAPITVGLPAVATIAVTIPSQLQQGDTVTAKAVLRDAQGNTLSGRMVTWSVNNSAIATISPSTGLVTAGEAGAVIVTAASEQQTGNALLHVVAANPGEGGGGGGGTPKAARLTVTTPPSSSVKNGEAFPQQPVIQVRDDSNNPFHQSGITVTAAIATGAGTLGGTRTAVTDANGVATFTSLEITGAVGARTLAFDADDLTGATFGPITVTAGNPTKLSISTQPPSSAESGEAFSRDPVIQLRDASNNAVSKSGVVVSVSIASGTGTLGGTTSATTNASGVATFGNLELSGSGTFTLRFAASGYTGTTSSAISVGAGAAGKLSISTQPSTSAGAGVEFSRQPVVRLLDDSNNPVSQSGVVITASITSGGGTLGGTTTATTNASGIATFTDLSIGGTIGTRRLRFAAASVTSVTSGSIVVTAGAPSKLAMVTQPSSTAESGTAFSEQPAVRIQDAWGNAVSDDGVTVTASVASGGGSLGGTVNATTNGSGVATFTNLRITGSGAHTLRFVAVGLAAVTCTTITVDSASPVASQLAVMTQPSTSASSGVTLSRQPAVQLRDEANHTVSQSGVVVTASIASGGGALGGSTSATTNASGVATFSNLMITGTTGNRTLRFSGAGLTPTTSGTVSVVAGAATQLAITTQPSSTILDGIAFLQQPAVQLRDASGNNVSQSGVVVSATIASGGGSLGGSTSATTNSSGRATFSNLSISGGVGTRTLRFSASSLGSVTSNGLTISGGGGGGGGSALMKINWSDYASFNALAADCTVFDCSNDHFGNNDVAIDGSELAPDGTKTLRYHYRHTGTGCNTITLSRDFRFPGGQSLTEAWAEFHIKWSTNFTTGGQSPAHSCDPNDHKLIFGLVDSPSGAAGRWAFYVGSDSDPYHNLNQERPYPLWGGAQLNMDPPSSESLWKSGTWHTVRLHLKNSTTGTSNDGVWEIWLDGNLIHRQTGFSVHDNGSNAPLKIRGFSLGRNKDDGPPNVDEYLWWGPVTVYSSNPGW